MDKKFEFNMCRKINKLQLYISFDFSLKRGTFDEKTKGVLQGF